MPTTPPDQPGTRIVIETPYEGGVKQWSNRWFFNGPDWDNEAEWELVSDYIVDKLVNKWLTARSTVMSAIGTNGGSDMPVYSKTYNEAGAFATGGKFHPPLESVGLCRFSTTQRSSKNHPIYLFKYMHDCLMDDTATPEVLYAFQRSQFGGALSTMLGGITTAGHTRYLCGPRGAVAQAALIETYFSHRDFLS